jgi:hypothetical protein
LIPGLNLDQDESRRCLKSLISIQAATEVKMGEVKGRFFIYSKEFDGFKKQIVK